MRSLLVLALITLVVTPAGTQSRRPDAHNPLAADVDRLTMEVQPQVVAWRRDFHEHPELGNREYRTSKVIAQVLAKLGYDVKTGVAHTGVVAVLTGAKPGPNGRAAGGHGCAVLRRRVGAAGRREGTDEPGARLHVLGVAVTVGDVYY